MGILRELGLFGLDNIEDIIITTLINADPVLFIGKHGSAKTLLARQLAKLMGLKYQEYDASKALFEDVIGFPNPDSLSKGLIEYTPTPMSIWGKEFVFIDEISRASPMMQNKWLEIIRSRQVMGLKIDSIKYIFSAMNPPGYLGSLPLDEALAGRFAVIIPIPEISQMDLSDIKLVLSNRSEDDSPGLKSAPAINYENIRENFLSSIEIARSKIPEIEKRYGEYLSLYLAQFLAAMKYHNRELDGRRLGMIRRNIIAYLALKSGTDASLKNLNDLIYKMLSFSLPYRAFGYDIYASTLKNIHLVCVENAAGETSLSVAHLKIFLSDDKYGLIDEYEKHCPDFTENEHYSVIAHIEGNFDDVKNLAKYIEGIFALGKLSSCYQNIYLKSLNIKNDAVRKTYDSFLVHLFGRDEVNKENQMIMHMLYHEKIIRASGRFLNVDPNKFSDCLTMLINIRKCDFEANFHSGRIQKIVESYLSISDEITEFITKRTGGKK